MRAELRLEDVGHSLHIRRVPALPLEVSRLFGIVVRSCETLRYIPLWARASEPAFCALTPLGIDMLIFWCGSGRMSRCLKLARCYPTLPFVFPPTLRIPASAISLAAVRVQAGVGSLCERFFCTLKVTGMCSVAEDKRIQHGSDLRPGCKLSQA